MPLKQLAVHSREIKWSGC